MQQALQFLELLNGRVAYHKLGNGPKRLVAFHGFGQNGKALLPGLKHYADADYTCYLVDLPFHGQTQWTDPFFTPSDLGYIVKRLVGKHPYEGLGHSLGGRFWMVLLPELDRLPEHLHLLAPDGIGSLWSGITKYSPPGLRRKSARWLKRPARFLQFAGLLHEWGIIDRFTLRYLQTQLATEATRQRLFGTWQSLLYFKMNKSRAQIVLAGAAFPVDIYLGTKDNIVPADRVAEALEGLDQVNLHRVSCGHWDIVQRWQADPGLS